MMNASKCNWIGKIGGSLAELALMQSVLRFVNPADFPCLAPLCGPQPTAIDCLSFSFNIPVFRLWFIALDTKRNLFSL